VNTCEHPNCAGHLAKFDSCLDEAIWELALDQAYQDDTTGDTDFRGHFTLIGFDEPFTTRLSDTQAWVVTRFRRYTDNGTSGTEMVYLSGRNEWSTDREAAVEHRSESLAMMWSANYGGTQNQVPAGAKVTIPAGWYIVENASGGAVTVHTYPTEAEARAAFAVEETEYADYLNPSVEAMHEEGQHARCQADTCDKAHRWSYGTELRKCMECGEKEAYWDDLAYPFNDCPARVATAD